jgi:hypothetical protein
MYREKTAAEREEAAQRTQELWRNAYFEAPSPKWATGMDTREHACGLMWEVEHIHPSADSGDKKLEQDTQKAVHKS